MHEAIFVCRKLGTIARIGNDCGNDCEKRNLFFTFIFCCSVVNLQQKSNRTRYFKKDVVLVEPKNISYK